jgi:hypothetical protein
MTALLAAGSSEFPYDPILVLREGWQCLVAYYIVATIVVFCVWRVVHASRFLRATKPRVVTAAILAGLYTPGEVSDFWLFTLPGPAFAGLLLLLVALALGAASHPAMLLKLSTWSGMLGLIGGYYILPMLVVFVIAYAALSLYSRSLVRVAPNA